MCFEVYLEKLTEIFSFAQNYPHTTKLRFSDVLKHLCENRHENFSFVQNVPHTAKLSFSCVLKHFS